MDEITNVIWVGFGAVATCLAEILTREDFLRDKSHTIIEPEPDKRRIDIFSEFTENFRLIKKAITVENYKKLLTPLFVKNATLLINLSVDVDSIMLMKLCNKYNTLYIDTSLENYPEGNSTKLHTQYSKIKYTTLYYRQKLAEKELNDVRKTQVFAGGQNPGMISEFVKYGLKTYVENEKPSLLSNWKGDYSKLAHEIGLKDIVIAEYDCQTTKEKPKKGEFINDWSSAGFYFEACLDNSMISLSFNDAEEYKKAGIELIDVPDNKHIKFLKERGMNALRDSQNLDRDEKVFNYSGMIVPHQEVCTLTDFLTYKKTGDCPSIMYVYKSCDVSIESLKNVKKDNYKSPSVFRVLWNDEVIDGYDSIMANLLFENGDRVLCGSCVNKDDTKQFKLKSNPTIMQVGAPVYGFISWMLENKNKGLVSSELIPHRYVMDKAGKYLGKIMFKVIKSK